MRAFALDRLRDNGGFACPRWVIRPLAAGALSATDGLQRHFSAASTKRREELQQRAGHPSSADGERTLFPASAIPAIVDPADLSDSFGRNDKRACRPSSFIQERPRWRDPQDWTVPNGFLARLLLHFQYFIDPRRQHPTTFAPGDRSGSCNQDGSAALQYGRATCHSLGRDQVGCFPVPKNSASDMSPAIDGFPRPGRNDLPYSRV
ncbi:MAG TPA: hypothetical protein VGD23_10420 [Sphingomicrobium sp.]